MAVVLEAGVFEAQDALVSREKLEGQSFVERLEECSAVFAIA